MRSFRNLREARPSYPNTRTSGRYETDAEDVVGGRLTPDQVRQRIHPYFSQALVKPERGSEAAAVLNPTQSLLPVTLDQPVRLRGEIAFAYVEAVTDSTAAERKLETVISQANGAGLPRGRVGSPPGESRDNAAKR